MKRALLILMLALGCRGRPQPPLTTAFLSLGAPSSSERHAAVRALDDLAARVQARLRAGAAPADALNGVVFEELKFQREVNDRDLRFMRLPLVLADHRGSCLGLGALYLALGERLGVKVDGVLVPGHFFVRVSDRNVELLRRGEQMPDSWYRERYEVPAEGAPAYLRPLAPAEIMAVFDYNIGNDLRLQGRFVEAAVAYRRAIAAFPQMAEAHASLGLVRHLSGALKEAEQAYLAARAVNPHLPGLENNLTVIREEMRRK